MLRLNIKNFQSLQDVFIDVNGITILRGESDVGKSAVIRCMRALLCNRWGRGMIRHGEPCCDVAVDFCDGNRLLARKSQENVIYRMTYFDGTVKDYTAMRREIPEEMGNIFGLTVLDDGTSKELLQIRGQYDRPLLVEVTHKRLSGMLGDGSEWVRCVNVDKLVHSWLGQQNGRVRGFVDLEESSEQRIAKIEESVNQTRKLKDDITESYSEIENLNERLTLLNELKKLSVGCDSISMRLSLLKDMLSLLSECSVLDTRKSDLESLKGCNKSVEGIPQVKEILSDIGGAIACDERVNDLQSLSALIKQMNETQFVIDDLHSRLQSDVCPLCGAKLNN